MLINNPITLDKWEIYSMNLHVNKYENDPDNDSQLEKEETPKYISEFDFQIKKTMKQYKN